MADNHPPPWSWESAEARLVDANGVPVVFLMSDEPCGAVIGFASAYAAIVTQAAPEMEALLRTHEWTAIGGTCHECVSSRPDHRGWCKWGALLAKIDDARKAGG